MGHWWKDRPECRVKAKRMFEEAAKKAANANAGDLLESEEVDSEGNGNSLRGVKKNRTQTESLFHQ